MDSQDLVWQAWRSLQETDAVFGHLPTVPPLETLMDVTTAVRMAVQIDAASDSTWEQLPLFGD